MGYWFRGFFLRTADQDYLPELVSSIKEQWPHVVCRLVNEPFVGLGVRMSSIARDVSDEKVEEQLAIEDELPFWSTRHPLVRFVYLNADCFGGACVYDGYVCRNGEILFKEEDAEAGPGPLRRLLKSIDVQLDGGYFPPFEREFFGPDRYFRQGDVQEDLEDLLCQETDFHRTHASGSENV